MLMIIAMLVVVGLCLGSFVNALVWRLHEQEQESDKQKPRKSYLRELSITTGRSMCPDCKHSLAAKDLLPVLSWLSLKGKCRYCHKPIPAQYPLVELTTAALFVISYLYWPVDFSHAQIAIFILWLLLLVGFMALVIYDLRWLLLPNRIIMPLSVIASLSALIAIASAERPARAFLNTFLAVVVGGGIFYVIFQLSQGKWIGGGDVKLGWLLGLIVATPARSVLFIFIAALLGSLVSLPLLVSKRLKTDSVIPFGPFLIIGAIIVQLFGHAILVWYRQSVLGYSV